MTVGFCGDFSLFPAYCTSKGARTICCLFRAGKRKRRRQGCSVNVSKTTKYRIPTPRSRDVQNVEPSRVSLPVPPCMSSLTVGELVASDAAFAHLANSTSKEFSDAGLHEESHPKGRSKSRALSPRGRALRVAAPGRIGWGGRISGMERADSDCRDCEGWGR
jgi:hypothetical protein